jgi:hypothetical protein
MRGRDRLASDDAVHPHHHVNELGVGEWLNAGHVDFP